MTPAAIEFLDEAIMVAHLMLAGVGLLVLGVLITPFFMDAKDDRIANPNKKD